MDNFKCIVVTTTINRRALVNVNEISTIIENEDGACVLKMRNGGALSSIAPFEDIVEAVRRIDEPRSAL